MRYLYSAFLRPKQPRSGTEWHVLTGITVYICHPHDHPDFNP